MSILWHPTEIERALSERMRRAEEAPSPMPPSPRPEPAPLPERVLIEWVEPVPLGAAVAYLLTMDMRRGGEEPGREAAVVASEEIDVKSEETDGT